jgi:hypothetical protein|tara:strand:+ start:426 stop:1019 length:594 start_codon:yes stop_codon:yes gene_type:complete
MAKKKEQTPEEINKKINIISEEEMKKLKDPYIAKDQAEWEAMRKKQHELRNSDTYKQKSFVIPNEAIINIPISGTFKNAIQDTLNFCMSRMSKDEVLRAMLNIQTDFEGIKDPKKITSGDMAIWCLMSILTEINFQAQEQGKLLATNQSVGDNITEFIGKLQDDPSYEVTQEEIDNITKDYKPIEGITDKDKKTNED